MAVSLPRSAGGREPGFVGNETERSSRSHKGQIAAAVPSDFFPGFLLIGALRALCSMPVVAPVRWVAEMSTEILQTDSEQRSAALRLRVSIFIAPHCTDMCHKPGNALRSSIYLDCNQPRTP